MRKSFPLFLILPLEGVLNFLLLIPVAIAVFLSLTTWTPLLGDWYEAPIVGGKNYAELIFFDRFVLSLLRTVLIVGVVVPLEFALGLGLALTMNRPLRGSKVFASILIIPMMTIPSVAAIVWGNMFFRDGAVNALVGLLSGTVVEIDWLAAGNTALLAVMLADIWQWTPFMFLILYAGLRSIPQDPLRAARILGASEYQVFSRITVPMLKPIILVALIIRSLEAFKLFDLPFLMTRGGPGTSTETITVFMYNFGLQFGRFGFISSSAIIVLVLVILASIYMVRPLMPKRERG